MKWSWIGKARSCCCMHTGIVYRYHTSINYPSTTDAITHTTHAITHAHTRNHTQPHMQLPPIIHTCAHTLIQCDIEKHKHFFIFEKRTDNSDLRKHKRLRLPRRGVIFMFVPNLISSVLVNGFCPPNTSSSVTMATPC
jgi:hypothetical protein